MPKEVRKVSNLSDWEYWDLRFRLIQLKAKVGDLGKDGKELTDELEFYLAGEINPWL